MNKVVIDYDATYQELASSPLSSWLEFLPALVEEALQPAKHGDVPRWLEVLYQLPLTKPSVINLTTDALTIGTASDMNDSDRAALSELLMHFQPWRKGPFNLFGIHIDTEWRSDWKWQRLADKISPLTGREVLDVGAGNGYYGWRMLGAGAKRVIGLDPTMRFVMQYGAISHFIGPTKNYLYPLRLEQIPIQQPLFDTVFSMGVIYHQRDHLGHIQMLQNFLKPGGELILEGLVIEGEKGDCLYPQKRYAKMHNVHAVPSCDTMAHWLEQCGLVEIELLDQSVTTLEEQRKTDWMVFESLADYLDPKDLSLTIEGYPAPCRAIFKATKP